MEVTHPIEKSYWSVDDASRYLGVKPTTIYEWAKGGEIPHYKVHKMIRFRKGEIDAWMERHREDCSVVEKKAKRVLEMVEGSRKSLKPDVDRVVRKSIEEVERGNNNDYNGNQTKVKGLRKEVKSGNL